MISASVGQGRSFSEFLFSVFFCVVVLYTANVRQVYFPHYVNIPTQGGVFFTYYGELSIYQCGLHPVIVKTESNNYK